MNEWTVGWLRKGCGRAHVGVAPCSVSDLFDLEMCVCVLSRFSCVQLCDPMDCGPPGSSVHGSSRQGDWSGLSCPPPGGLPDSGTEPVSLRSPALAGGFFTTSAVWEDLETDDIIICIVWS